MLPPLFLLSLILPCASENLPCDFQRPEFISQDLNNILIWTPPEKSEGIKYSVTYLIYGTEMWHKIPKCTNITHTWCDLTKETSDYEQDYYGNVSVNSHYCSTITNRFYPRLNTKIGPPTISLSPTDTFMEIKLAHPIQKTAKNLMYHIYVNDEKIAETKDPYYKIEHLDSNTTYCVTAAVEWFSRKSIQSNQTCVTMNAVYISQRTLVMVGVVPVILVILSAIALGCIIHKYIYVNMRLPHILNVKASDKNVILVEAHNVIINLINNDGNSNLQHTKIPDTEERKEESKIPSDLHLTNDDKHISLDSGITEADEGSDDDHGYKSLQEEMIPVSPTISPYDMPHYIHKPVGPLDTSSDIANEGNLYGRIKCHSIHNNPMQEKEDMYVVQNGYTPENFLDANTYISQGASRFAVQDKEEHFVLEEFCTDQNLDKDINLMTGTDLDEGSMLFVDWSPDNPHLYITNLSKNKKLEKCIQQCQEEKERFLNQVEVMDMAEDELKLLEERWGLRLQDVEK